MNGIGWDRVGSPRSPSSRDIAVIGKSKGFYHKGHEGTRRGKTIPLMTLIRKNLPPNERGKTIPLMTLIRLLFTDLKKVNAEARIAEVHAKLG